MTGTRVYLGGLSYRVSERDIDRFFKGFNGVGDIVIKNGFAFVEFDDHREAEDAIHEMNGKELLGGRVTVEKAKGTPRPSRFDHDNGYGSSNGRGYGGGRDNDRRGGGGGYMRRNPRQRPTQFRVPQRTDYRLTVMNLSSKVSWQDLKDFMRQAGEVTYADAHSHRKNEGVIEFASSSGMRTALSRLEGKELCGRRIKLRPQNEDALGGRGGGRDRSRDRSPLDRSRSRSGTPRGRGDRSPKDQSPYRSRSRSVSRSRSASSDRSPRKRNNNRTPPRNDRAGRSGSSTRSDGRGERSSRSQTPPRHFRRSTAGGPDLDDEDTR